MKNVQDNDSNTIGYLGLPGSFSYIAAKKFLNSAKLISCQTFEQIVDQVCQEKLSLGILPIENSLFGSVVTNYDLLVNSSLFITNEVYLRIRQNLLAKTPIPFQKLRFVYSHPEAFKQCDKFLNKLAIKKIAMCDTASAAAYIAKEGKKTEAAIASLESAELYKLAILKKGIETNKNNFSRFVIVAKQAGKKSIHQANKATVVFNLQHKPGKLYNALGVLAKRKLNLTKIESRPILGKPFEYLFILDFEFGNLSLAQNVIYKLKQHTTFQRVLGFYQKGDLNEN